MAKLFARLIKPTSIFLGLTFFGAGMAKLYFQHRYFGWIGPVWLEERLEPYQLGLYARFIAYSQVIIGYLMLTLRFRLLGAIMAMPLIVNILMVTISQHWSGTPYVLSILLAMNLYLLIMEGGWLLPLLGIAPKAIWPVTLRNWKGHLIWMVGLMLNLASISVSFYQVYAAWGISLLGITLSFISFRLDKIQNT
ncbi:hypothetical protein [Marinoscillum pacificum]|uniref:hypothetical protein n=1 Tax=Marinoscillum pacificum TaxID=392723 RepID=UPI0021583F41|nr:hypothetical protein [Marinoscillum pacificum]